LCFALGIEYKIAEPVHIKDGYIAGLFVSDGSIFFKSSFSAATKRSIKESEEKSPQKLSPPVITKKIVKYSGFLKE
jgi:hypothetical protein